MKSLFLKIFIFFTPYLFSQNKISINYKFNYKYDISKSENPKTINIYKESNKKIGDYLLITTEEESSFNNIDKIDNNQGSSEVKSIPLPSGLNYINYKDKFISYNLDFRGQKILIKDSLNSYNWIITKDQDELLGYKLKKAIYNEDIITYIAWYAPDLPFKSGPGSYWGLPGIILKLEIIMNQDDGIHKKYYTATNIELNNKLKIIKPTKGRVFNEKEFTKYFNNLFKIENEIENEKVETD